MAGRYENTPAWLDETVRAHLMSRKPRGDQGRSDDARWVADEELVVGGFSIPRPLVYFGNRLASVEKWFGGTEPALIDPRLAVEPPNDRVRQLGLGYRLAYSNLAPPARGVYLQWLAGGRSRNDVHVDYARLFLFGIERRLLADFITKSGNIKLDDEQRKELKLIREELHRLATIFSFSDDTRHRCQMLDTVAANIAADSTPPRGNPPQYIQRWTTPAHLRYALGCFHKSHTPVPSLWALSWYAMSAGARFRTPAKRCPEEFRGLFCIRFEQAFPDGFFLQAQRRHKQLVIDYRTDSWSLLGSFVLRTTLVDFGDDSEQLQPIADIAAGCEEELNDFSRYVGANRDADALGARALLPVELLSGDNDSYAQLRALAARAVGESDIGYVNGSELIELWDPEAAALSKVASTSLARLLSALGFGLIPDPRFERQVLGSMTAVIYRTHGQPLEEPTDAMNSALAICDLAVHVIAPEGNCDDTSLVRLLDDIAQTANLDTRESRHLYAHAKWRVTLGAKITGVKARLKDLRVDHTTVANLLLKHAASSGFAETSVMKGLHKALDLLGVESTDVYRAMHHGETLSQNNDEQTETAAFSLDHERIRQTKDDSHRVSELLAGIFESDAPVTGSNNPVPGNESSTSASNPTSRELGAQQQQTIGGLDAAHSSLLEALGNQPKWDQAEVEVLCSRFGLLAEGAIDTINEAAFDLVDEPVIEPGPPLEIDFEVLERLKSDS